MPTQLTYRIVDVFTNQPFLGNPLAVVLGGIDLSTDAMQTIAREMNLSETVFVLPANDARCAARLRIFTPNKELPFAGHPTVGATFVLVNDNIVAADLFEFALQENVGPVHIRRERGAAFMAWLTTPTIEFGAVHDRAACAAALGLSEIDLIPGVEPQIVSAGVPGVFVALRDKGAVDRAVLDEPAMRAALGPSDALERFVFCPTEGGAYSRMFLPALGIPEDPATGGLTGPLAAYMMRYGLAPHAAGTRLVSEQGVKMGRRSLLHVQINGDFGVDGIEVGGTAAPVAQGTLIAPEHGL